MLLSEGKKLFLSVLHTQPSVCGVVCGRSVSPGENLAEELIRLADLPNEAYPEEPGNRHGDRSEDETPAQGLPFLRSGRSRSRESPTRDYQSNPRKGQTRRQRPKQVVQGGNNVQRESPECPGQQGTAKGEEQIRYEKSHRRTLGTRTGKLG